MREVTRFLINRIQYFATIGLDGKPKVRPFQFMLEQDGKLYFCTANTKDVFKEMKANPYVEICASGENFSWMRLSGKVVFSSNIQIKELILDKNELVKSIYQTADNPSFELFYLENAEAVIRDFSGKPPEKYTL